MDFEVQEENKSEDKKAKKPAVQVGALQRKLPLVINDLLERGFDIKLTKEGYLIGGFYGLNNTGYAIVFEGLEENTLVVVDYKNNKHLITSFEDLVKFNGMVWSYYFKQKDEYKKPNVLWFNYLLEFGALSISPK